ncbi:GAF domain-containing SpoIIE family protein phosphatase [Leptospira sp. GIMC2001]|uniref:GAF domain-containing SpoIIE family protein phosphatase n=1 Tax=Leptospira sp. GIMC2001 TaxID=1513297 RepID=UPI00234ADC6E|nr:GAF domain-containing SpoIIE family protein phosphatase [Leptospira sp. GIMC2001]WCL49020.1 SpoIIE family protein phosphatase [Leptospira sp. GIMC2001]
MLTESKICVLCGEEKTPEGETKKARFYCMSCGKEWILEKRRSTRFGNFLLGLQQEQKISLLLDSLALFNSTLKMQDLVTSYSSFIHQRLGERNVAILLIDTDRAKIRLAGYKSKKTPLERLVHKIHLDYDVSYGILIRSMTEAKSFYYEMNSEKHPFYKYYSDLTGTKSQLVVPIIYGNHPIGLVTMDYSHDDGSKLRDEQEIMELLTGQFAVALRNAMLYDRSKSQSTHFQNLHLSALTLSKLYLDNHDEMMRMILLTASGFLDTTKNILYENDFDVSHVRIYELNRSAGSPGMNTSIREIPREKVDDILKIKEPIRQGQDFYLPFTLEDGTEFYFHLSREDSNFSMDDFEVLNAYVALAKITIDNTRLYRSMSDQKKIEREIEIAREIQLNLLPRNTPNFPGYEFGGFMEAARGVGGDYYDFITSPDNSEVVICIGDVSGKGVGAGMVMATVRTILHSLVRKKPSPDEILTNINTYLYYNYRDSPTPRFMTMTIISWDPETGIFHYSGAGHGSILVHRNKTNTLEFIETKGIILGIQPDIQSFQNNGEILLNPGDTMLLITDGVTESMNEKGESFEDERVYASFIKNINLDCKSILTEIYKELKQFAGTKEQHDDITMISIKRYGSNQ